MSVNWPSSKARRVYRALIRRGWTVKSAAKSGSHIQLEHPEHDQEFTWAFHDSVEIGPKMLARIAKQTGLKPEDL
jgi:predicted RNA binding protein YcfA (HicA-like mRNA interferase family)